MIQASIIVQSLTSEYDWWDIFILHKALASERSPYATVVEAGRISTVNNILAHMQMIAMSMWQPYDGNRSIGAPCVIGLRPRKNLSQHKSLQLQIVEFERINTLHGKETFQKVVTGF